jgi:hypothetical protein
MLVTPHVFPRTQAGQAVFAANSLGATQASTVVGAAQQVQTVLLRVWTPAIPLRRFVLHFANWWVNWQDPNQEVAAGNVATIKAAIQFMRVPGETKRPLAFAGAASLAQASGATSATDPVVDAPAFIPARTEVLICIEHVVATAGTRVGGSGGLVLSRINEAVSSNWIGGAFNDIPRGTVGDFTGTAGNARTGPIAMTAETVDGRTISILGTGDSIFRGGDDESGDGFGNSGGYQRALFQLGYPVGVMAVAGTSPGQSATDTQFGRRAPFAAYATTHFSQHGHNSAYGAAGSAPTVLGQMQTWWSYLRAKKNMAILQCTIGPRTTSTDSFATLAGQSDFSGGLPDPSSGASPQNQATAGVRWQMNDRIRQKPFPVTGVVEIGPVWSDPNEPWKFRTNGTPFYYSTDGSHLSTQAHVDAMPEVRRAARMFA